MRVFDRIATTAGSVGRVLAEDASPHLNPLDDRLYSDYNGGQSSLAGVSVTPESAARISAVWRAVDLLASTAGKLPLNMYRNLPGGGKQKVPGHPLDYLLHDQPNDEQDAFEWREMMMGHALLRGHAYSELLPGKRGKVDQIVPLHPDRVTPKDGERIAGGGRRWWYRNDDGTKRPILAEDMFHLRGAWGGVSMIEAAKESLGLGIALTRYGAATFGNGARPSGILSTDKIVADPGKANLRAQFEKIHRGSENAGRVAVLDDGVKWTQVGMTVADAEFVATMQWSVADWARWFGVPPHKLAQLERSTNNNIEHQGIEFVVDGWWPWEARFEQAIQRDMITTTGYYFAAFDHSLLLMGDMISRGQYYNAGIQGGWFCPDDVRAMNGDNPLPNGQGKIYRSPLNMGPLQDVGEEKPPAPNPFPPAQPPVDDQTDQPDDNQDEPPTPPTKSPGSKSIGKKKAAFEAADRIVRKETVAMTKLAVRTDADQAAWQAGVRDFYATHGAFVAQILGVSETAAGFYAAAQRNALIQLGPATLSPFLANLAAQCPQVLADMALTAQEDQP